MTMTDDAVIQEDLTVMSDDLLFLDTETLGLELDHDIFEIAYAIGEGEVVTHWVPHSLKNANPQALELNKYWDRSAHYIVDRGIDVMLPPVFEGRTVVGANPSFDTYRLQMRWGKLTWKYRMIDVESQALSVLGLPRPVGLHTLVQMLCDRGFQIPENDHTAAADVLAVREVYRALRHIERNQNG